MIKCEKCGCTSWRCDVKTQNGYKINIMKCENCNEERLPNFDERCEFNG